jgi:hypothetical protein
MISDSDYADVPAPRQQRQISAPDSSTPPRPMKRLAGLASTIQPFASGFIELATPEGLSWEACAGDIGVPGKR